VARRSRTVGRPAADWNIDKLIARFNGIEPLIIAHREAGFLPLTYPTVFHWRKRHQIPADRLAELFVVLRERDGAIDLTDYLQYRT
jgi:hypothetical protein